MVPFESPGPWLLIGTKMVEFGPLVTKLWPVKVNNHFTKQFSPLCRGFRTYVKTAYLHINSRRFFVHKEKRTTLLIRISIDFELGAVLDLSDLMRIL